MNDKNNVKFGIKVDSFIMKEATYEYEYKN